MKVLLARQIFGFLFLTFIPGYTILRILRIHGIDKVEAFLYATGLSIFYIMIFGVAINFIYPSVGIKKPLTLKPLLLTIDLTYLLLLIGAYIKDKDYWIKWNSINETKLKDILSPQVLMLSFLPFLAIWGAKVFDYTGNFILIVFVFIIISMTPVVIVLTKTFEKHLTYTIWSLSLSLLYLSGFGTSWNYLWGWDINVEYYVAHLILTTGIWEPQRSFSAINLSKMYAMWAIVVLNPTYSILLDITPIMVFKVFYPFILSLVPVGLYKAYNYFLGKKESFLSTFFFISLYTFFTEILQTARQQIAEFYLTLLILQIFTKNLNNIRGIFLLIFGFGVIISHYGTAWLLLISLLIGWILYTGLYPQTQRGSLLRGSYIAILVVVSVSYYSTASNSSIFNVVVHIGDLILSSIYEMFTLKAQGLYFITKTLPRLHEIGKYVYLITQGIIGVGILWLLFNYKKTKINKEFLTLIFIWFSYTIAGIVVPYFSATLNTSRLYQLTLFFLSPLEVLGLFVLQGILSRGKLKFTRTTMLKCLAIFLMVYLLFNSSILYKLANEPPYFGYLDKTISYPRFSNSEVISGLWIGKYKNNHPIYADMDRAPLFLGLLGQSISDHAFLINLEGDIIQPKNTIYDYYLFLGLWNIENQKLKVAVVPLGRGDRVKLPIETPEIFNILLQSNKIYSSQNAQYYLMVDH